MEEWKEVSTGACLQGSCQTQLSNSEEKGLVLELTDGDHHIVLDFGFVRAVRMLDEGIVQEDIYAGSQFEKFKKDGFQNIIYEVTGGKFGKQIQQMADGYWEVMNLKHYVVITQNYDIDILTEWEPEISTF